MREWERMPLPLGAVGAMLRSSDAERLHRIFTFMETTVSLALSYGLAVAYRSGRWSLPPADLAAALDQSSLGSRAQLLQQLDCGWDLRTRSAGFRDVVSLALGSGQLPRGRGEPSVAQALQAMVAARNQLAHPSIPNAIRPDAAGAVADGVVELARTNRWFGYRLLRADGFAAMPDGRPGVIATSMTGLHPAPYRGHAPIFAPEVHSVGELFLYRDDGGARELCLLSPFVVARGPHVYFLADYRKGRPVLWCSSADAPAPDEAMTRAVEAVLGASSGPPSPVPGLVEALASSPSGVSARVTPTPSRKGWMVGAGVVAALVLLALVVVFLAWRSDGEVVAGASAGPLTGSASGASSGWGPSPSRPLEATPSSGTTANYDRDEALWALLRLPTRFGVPPSELMSTGSVGPARGPECVGATWSAYDVYGHSIPAATTVRAWADADLGLVEVAATSDASPNALIDWVERTLGRPPTGRAPRSARWCLGDRGVSVAIDRRGRPMLRIVHEPLRARFGEKRREHCPDEYEGGGAYRSMCP